MPNHKAPIPALTSVRFFLSVWVMLFHLTVPNPLVAPIPDTINSFVYRIIRTAYSAVSLFFIISGFSLAYNHEASAPWPRAALKKYALTRFTRIYPIYLLGLLLMLPVELHELLPRCSPVNLAREAGTALLNLGMVQSWLPRAALSWNPPGWSLSAEAFFYACFPFLGILARQAPDARRRLALGLSLWLLALVAPLAAVALPAHGFGDVPATSFLADADPRVSDFIKFNPLLRLPDFCIGVLLGRQFAALRRSGHPLLGKGAWFWLPGCAALLAALAMAQAVPYPLFHNFLTVPFCALIVFGLALDEGRLSRFLAAPPWVFLGNASFSIYILHIPVLIYMGFLYRAHFRTRMSGVGWGLGYGLTVIALSCAAYKWIELPLNRYFRKKISGSV